MFEGNSVSRWIPTPLSGSSNLYFYSLTNWSMNFNFSIDLNHPSLCEISAILSSSSINWNVDLPSDAENQLDWDCWMNETLQYSCSNSFCVASHRALARQLEKACISRLTLVKRKMHAKTSCRGLAEIWMESCRTRKISDDGDNWCEMGCLIIIREEEFSSMLSNIMYYRIRPN